MKQYTIPVPVWFHIGMNVSPFPFPQTESLFGTGIFFVYHIYNYCGEYIVLDVLVTLMKLGPIKTEKILFSCCKYLNFNLKA